MGAGAPTCSDVRVACPLHTSLSRFVVVMIVSPSLNENRKSSPPTFACVRVRTVMKRNTKRATDTHTTNEKDAMMKASHNVCRGSASATLTHRKSKSSRQKGLSQTLSFQLLTSIMSAQLAQPPPTQNLRKNVEILLCRLLALLILQTHTRNMVTRAHVTRRVEMHLQTRCARAQLISLHLCLLDFGRSGCAIVRLRAISKNCVKLL